MTEKQETFAERLARAMAAKGYKQADLIRIAGDRGMKLGKSQVSQYANGKTVPPQARGGGAGRRAGRARRMADGGRGGN